MNTPDNPKGKVYDDDFFIRNAILAWMHHYPNHKWTTIYEELASRDNYIPKPTPRPDRRRKANAKESATVETT